MKKQPLIALVGAALASSLFLVAGLTAQSSDAAATHHGHHARPLPTDNKTITGWRHR